MKIYGMNRQLLNLFTILGSLLLTALLGGCPAKKDVGVQAPNVALSSPEMPVVDGHNKLLDKYNFGGDMVRVSDSVTSTTQPEIIDTDPGNLELERWVMMYTSKGNVKIKVHRDWAPHGAQRFLELVQSGFYDEAPFFRVTEGIAQFGVAADPGINSAYKDQTIEADPMQGRNTRGTLSFVQRDPSSRSTQVFINLQDNPALDGGSPAGYFVPFAEVMEGMNVLEGLFVTGDQDKNFMDGLEARGLPFFKRAFPEGDIIQRMVMMD